jgi:hypothetical protein
MIGCSEVVDEKLSYGKAFVLGVKVHLADWVSHEMTWTDYRLGFEMSKRKTANKAILMFDDQV